MTDKDWRLKVSIDCPDCKNGYSPTFNIPCKTCNSTGKVQKSVPPKAIDDFFLRPEKAEFVCVCGKKEIILRPTLNQIPSGWISWGGSILCSNCKTKIIYAAIMAANQKVMQLKERKDK